MSRFLLVIVNLGLASLFIYTAAPLFLGDGVGADYTFFLPRLLYGYFWQIENGFFAVPWFSPAWCGGLPYFADPQVMFFSVPQLLMLVLDPQHSVFATFAIFAVFGGLGFYGLARAFGLSQWFALIAAWLFVFNEFYTFRLLAGHFTYHVFALTACIALFLINSSKSEGSLKWVNLLLAGVSIAYVVHAGGSNFLLPMMLSITAIALIYSMKANVSLLRLGAGLLQAGFVGFLLSVSKISAGIAFVRWFPRDSLSLGIFESLSNASFSILTMLFMNPWLVLKDIPKEFLVQAEELRYGVTVIPLLFLLLGIAALPKILVKINARNLFALFVLILIASLPIILSIESSEIDAVIKSLPYFREMSLAVRWVALLIPLAILVPILLAQLVVDEVETQKTRQFITGVMVVLSLVLIVPSHLLVDRSLSVQYDPSGLNDSYKQIQEGGSVPVTTEISSQPENKTFLGTDDDFLSGGSSKVCYQPLFGYRLENYPIKSLRSGSLFNVQAERLNMKNPACYLFPDENQCHPGDHFTVDQEDELAKFSTNQPFEWQQSWWQTLANWLNLAALIAMLIALPVLMTRTILRLK
jgi:hypothetical protein